MPGCRASLALFLALLALPLAAAPAPQAEAVAATVLTLEGEAALQEGEAWQGLEPGQLLAPGDRVRTGEGSGLQLLLADGSSVALGANTELELKELGGGGAGSRTVLGLAKGLLNAFVERLTGGAAFEVQTYNAIAAVKGTDFEVEAAGPDSTVVTVAEGEVQLGDAGRRRFEPVRPLERRRFQLNRMLAAEALGRRDLGDFRARWERARSFHAQRLQLLKHFREQKADRKRWLKALEERRRIRESRRESWRDQRKLRREKLKERRLQR